MTESDYVELIPADLAHRWRERTVTEYVAEAVQQDVSEEYATPDSALRWLRQCAWSELQNARRNALNGKWSMNCDSLVGRIMGLTRLVGPEPWQSVQVDLILDGIYEQINAAAGHPTPLTDADRQRAQEVMDRRNS